MFGTEFKSIVDLLDRFHTDQKCIDYLEQLRWRRKVVSPFDKESRVYKCSNNRYRCASSKKYFNVKTNTLFHDTKIPLKKWFVAIYLATSHKKGISSVQLSKEIDVTQKTAWFMLHRIRKCFGVDHDHKMDGVVEVDETFVGGKNKNRHADKKYKYGKGRRFEDKITVMGLLERDTHELRLFPIKSPSIKETSPIIFQNIDKKALICTDEWNSYHQLSKKGYNHKVIRHNQGKWQEGEVSTNRIENVWSVIKRTYHGTYIKLTRKHIENYCNEFAYRFNHRLMSECQRFNYFFHNIEHRTTWRELTSSNNFKT